MPGAACADCQKPSQQLLESLTTLCYVFACEDWDGASHSPELAGPQPERKPVGARQDVERKRGGTLDRCHVGPLEHLSHGRGLEHLAKAGSGSVLRGQNRCLLDDVLPRQSHGDAFSLRDGLLVKCFSTPTLDQHPAFEGRARDSPAKHDRGEAFGFVGRPRAAWPKRDYEWEKLQRVEVWLGSRCTHETVHRSHVQRRRALPRLHRAERTTPVHDHHSEEGVTEWLQPIDAALVNFYSGRVDAPGHCKVARTPDGVRSFFGGVPTDASDSGVGTLVGGDFELHLCIALDRLVARAFRQEQDIVWLQAHLFFTQLSKLVLCLRGTGTVEESLRTRIGAFFVQQRKTRLGHGRRRRSSSLNRVAIWDSLMLLLPSACPGLERG